jgi:hypothetical protein
MTSDTAPPDGGPTPAEDSSPAASGSKQRSPAVLAAIVIVVVAVLAGGGYAIYKLTNKHTQQPALTTAKVVLIDIQNGKQAEAEKKATSAGAAAIAKIDAASVKGLAFAGCGAAPAKNTRVCTWTRPGGALAISLVRSGDSWKVTNVQLGLTGLPPKT